MAGHWAPTARPLLWLPGGILRERDWPGRVGDILSGIVVPHPAPPARAAATPYPALRWGLGEGSRRTSCPRIRMDHWFGRSPKHMAGTAVEARCLLRHLAEEGGMFQARSSNRPLGQYC